MELNAGVFIMTVTLTTCVSQRDEQKLILGMLGCGVANLSQDGWVVGYRSPLLAFKLSRFGKRGLGTGF